MQQWSSCIFCSELCCTQKLQIEVGHSSFASFCNPLVYISTIYWFSWFLTVGLHIPLKYFQYTFYLVKIFVSRLTVNTFQSSYILRHDFWMHRFKGRRCHYEHQLCPIFTYFISKFSIRAMVSAWRSVHL